MNIILVTRGFLKNRCKDTKFFGIDNSQFTFIIFLEFLLALKYIKIYIGVALLPLRHIKLVFLFAFERLHLHAQFAWHDGIEEDTDDGSDGEA